MAPIGSSNLVTSTTTTISIIRSQTKIGHTTGTSDNTLGTYQILTVGTSDRMIQVLVPLPMDQPPYRKAMVANLFFRAVKGLTRYSSLSSTNLVATIVAYLDFNTCLVELEMAAAAGIIHTTIFRIENLIGLGFRNRHGSAVTFDANDERPATLYYVAFRSILRASNLDDCGPGTLFSFDFVFRLP